MRKHWLASVLALWTLVIVAYMLWYFVTTA